MIKIYSTEWCPECKAGKRWLSERGFEFTEIDIEQENISREKLQEITGGRSVPQFEVANEFFSGIRNLMQADKEGQLGKLLARSY